MSIPTAIETIFKNLSQNYKNQVDPLLYVVNDHIQKWINLIHSYTKLQ